MAVMLLSQHGHHISIVDDRSLWCTKIWKSPAACCWHWVS